MTSRSLFLVVFACAACKSSNEGPYACSDAPADVVDEPLTMPSAPWFTADPATACQDRTGATIRSIVVAKSGDIFVAGEFRGNADFGAGPPTPTFTAGSYVAAFDANGHERWARTPGAGWLAVDDSGDLAAAYETGAGNSENESLPVEHFTLFDANGNAKWQREVPMAAGSPTGGVVIAFAPDGTLVAAATGQILRLDTMGNVIDQHDADFERASGIGVDPTGDVFVAGTPNGPSGNIFVARYGGAPWRMTYPYDSSVVAATGPAVAVAGTFPPGDLDFLKLFTRDGHLVWERNLTDLGTGAGNVTFDIRGHAIVSSLGIGAAIGVGAFDCSGTRSWTRRFSQATFGNAVPLAAAVPGSTDVVLAGTVGISWGTDDPTVCLVPQPYIFRIKRDGTLADGFEAHR